MRWVRGSYTSNIIVNLTISGGVVVDWSYEKLSDGPAPNFDFIVFKPQAETLPWQCFVALAARKVAVSERLVAVISSK